MITTQKRYNFSRICTFLLTVALMVSMLYLPASAADSDFTIENGVLTKYTGPGGVVTIPDSVTEIGEFVFGDCTSLTSVNIPKSAATIGRGAFTGCTNLTSVTIPEGVTTIEDTAFAACTSLSSITIPSSVTLLGSLAFSDCTSLSNLNIQPGITVIYLGTFSGCTSLTSVTIPNTVTTIYDWAFGGCTSLMTVNIPSSATLISEEPFADCPSLTIMGTAGSAAETHAKAYNIPFVSGQIPAETTPMAYARSQSIWIDGKTVSFQTYALKDAKGNETNYVKLRDIASALNGTAAQFEVGYDGTITITTGKAYTPNGSEMSTPFSGDKEYKVNSAAVKVNGVAANLDGIVLTDAGGGYTYFKLRDLGKALGFNVSWSTDTARINIDTTKPYSDN